MARNHRIDRALRVRQRGVWIATAAIALVGVVVVALAFGNAERRRERAVSSLSLGDEARRVEALLGGGGIRCPAASIGHLRGSLPEEWGAAAAETALGRMARETAERRVYPLDHRGQAGCSVASGATEVGLGADGRVLWYVAVTGRTRMTLPAAFAEEAGGEGSGGR